MKHAPRPKGLTLAAAFAILTLLSGCVSYRIKTDGITRATLNETVKVGSVTVTPLRVIEDSRCPASMDCVWAGRVRLEARVTTATGNRTGDLELNGKGLPVPGGALRLVEVYPQRRNNQTIYPEDYRFGFRIEAAQ